MKKADFDDSIGVGQGGNNVDRWLQDSLKLMEELHMFKRLEKVYEQIPTGQCEGCGCCCGESVRTHFVEFLNIYAYLMERQLITSDFKERLMRFYFTELAEVHECPFRKEGQCLIYPVRPLVCRLFGHVDEDEHLAGLQAIHAQNKEAADFLKAEYGLDVPEKVIYKTIPYCREFMIAHKMHVTERIALSTEILMMDSEFFKWGLVDEYHVDYGLVQWFIDLWIDPDEADELRIQVAVELLENGTSGTLKRLIQENC